MNEQIVEVSSSRLRTMLAIAERRIDRSKYRYEAIEMSNRIRDRFNAYAEEHSEVGFQIKQKSGYQPMVEVKVLGFDDGMWAYSVDANLPDRGMGGPFSDDVRPNKREAIRAGVGIALGYMLRAERDGDAKNVKSEAKRAIAEMRKFFGSAEQRSLF